MKCCWLDPTGQVCENWSEQDYINNTYTKINDTWYSCCPICGSFFRTHPSEIDAKHNYHWCISCVQTYGCDKNVKIKNKGYDHGKIKFHTMKISEISCDGMTYPKIEILKEKN